MQEKNERLTNAWGTKATHLYAPQEGEGEAEQSGDVSEEISLERERGERLPHKNTIYARDLKTLPMDEGRAGLIILFLLDPHRLEGRQRRQNGTTNPDAVFPLWRGNNLDLH